MAAAWVTRAMGRHIARLGIAGAPEPGSDESDAHARAWERQFRHINASEGEVEAAMVAVLASPPKWWVEQCQAIVDAVLSERSTNPARVDWPDDVPASREDAERASRSCHLCEGSGWAEVFHRDYDGRQTIDRANPDGTVTRSPARFRLACVCAAGKWLLRANEKSAADAEGEWERDRRGREVARMRGIERVMQGHTEYTTEDPTIPDLRGVEMPEGLGDWRAMASAWATAKDAAKQT